MSQLWSSPKSPTSAGHLRYPGRRFAQIVKLKPEFIGKYKEVHAAVWPEVLEQIQDCNIQDCTFAIIIKVPNLNPLGIPSNQLAADSIFHDPETGILFANFKYVGNDYEGDMERMRQNPKVQEWWRMTDGMQESLVSGAKNSESGEPSWWKPIEEVFYNA